MEVDKKKWYDKKDMFATDDVAILPKSLMKYRIELGEQNERFIYQKSSG